MARSIRTAKPIDAARPSLVAPALYSGHLGEQQSPFSTQFKGERARVNARLHDLRHMLGSVLRRTMSKEDVTSTMGISGAIAATYLDHESAGLTRRASQQTRHKRGTIDGWGRVGVELR